MAEWGTAEQVRLLQEGLDILARNLDDFEAARSTGAGLSAAVLERFLSEEQESSIAHGDTEWVLLSSVVVSRISVFID